jgi:hypothetical protein
MDNLCNNIHAQYPTYAILPTIKLGSLNNAHLAPGSQTNADPDLGHTLPLQKVKFLQKIIFFVGNRCKSPFKGWKSGFFVNFSQFPCF